MLLGLAFHWLITAALQSQQLKLSLNYLACVLVPPPPPPPHPPAFPFSTIWALQTVTNIKHFSFTPPTTTLSQLSLPAHIWMRHLKGWFNLVKGSGRQSSSISVQIILVHCLRCSFFVFFLFIMRSVCYGNRMTTRGKKGGEGRESKRT